MKLTTIKYIHAASINVDPSPVMTVTLGFLGGGCLLEGALGGVCGGPGDGVRLLAVVI